MHAYRKTLSVPALLSALAFILPAAATSQGKPDFSGSWTFARQKSDDVRGKVLSAVGSNYTVGSDKSEQTRVWIRSWLEGFANDPEKRILTIEQTVERFQAALGDEVNNYYFGREATSSGPAGGVLKATVIWQGEQIVAEEKQAKGKGRIRSTFTLLPGGGSLQLDWHLEHQSFEKPLDVRLVFDRNPK